MHAGELAELDMLRRYADRLRDADHGSRAAIVAEAASWLQCSQPTLYRRLREIGWTSGRKVRTDKGDSRVAYNELLALSAMWASASARRQNGKWVLTMQDCIDMARANGQLTVDISPATALRLMQQHGLHRDQVAAPTPHVQMQSLHPNHVWQIDPSVCIVYYSQRDGVRVLDEKKFYKNKPQYVEKMTPLRVWRYVCTDHYSGALYARYFSAAGENQETLFQFLMSAMQPQDSRHLMRGVPHCLVWDAGSANTSHGIQQLLTALQVRHWAHVPGNSRAKGSVENGNNLVEIHFEGRLSFRSVPSVEELNAHLDDWLIAWNSTRKHSRHGHTRYGLWQTIQQSQLRLRPDEATCRALLTSRPEPRLVRGDLTISYAIKGHGSAQYSVEHVPNVRVGDQLQVVVHAYRAPAICVVQQDAEGRTRFIECTPIETNAAGFNITAPVFGESYARKGDTAADTARKDQAEAAFGTRDVAEAEKARAGGAVAFGGAIDPFKDVREAAAAAPAHIVRRGSEMNLPNPVQIELKPLSLVEALRALREWLGRPIAADERQRIEQWYPQGVPETELQDIVNRLSQPAQEERPRLAIVR